MMMNRFRPEEYIECAAYALSSACEFGFVFENLVEHILDRFSAFLDSLQEELITIDCATQAFRDACGCFLSNEEDIFIVVNDFGLFADELHVPLAWRIEM